tara:strand:- start:4691 stop:4897 length:207 start_codon:yes stop_codon:yes gene_type:complete
MNIDLKPVFSDNSFHRRDGKFLLADGGLAQLVEHQLCKLGVIGSIPLASTISSLAFLKSKKRKKKWSR